MAAHVRLKNEFTEDKKYHKLMRWFKCANLNDLFPQTNLYMSRELAALKAQMQEMKNMMKVSFDLQLDIQRAIRQEVAAGLAAAMASNGENHGIHVYHSYIFLLCLHGIAICYAVESVNRDREFKSWLQHIY